MKKDSKLSARKKLSESTINTIWQFHLYGVRGAQTARHLGLAKSTVNYNIRKLRRHPQYIYVKALRIGRPLKLDERAERYLICWVAMHPFATIEIIAIPLK